jgi:hypothetical protein
MTAALIVATVAMLNTLRSSSFLERVFIDFLCLSTISREPRALADQAAANLGSLPLICPLADHVHDRDADGFGGESQFDSGLLRLRASGCADLHCDNASDAGDHVVASD